MLMVPFGKADAWFCPCSRGPCTPGGRGRRLVTPTVALNGDPLDSSASTEISALMLDLNARKEKEKEEMHNTSEGKLKT